MVPYRPSRVEEPPEGCPLTECLALLGGAWTPNVVWYLREARAASTSCGAISPASPPRSSHPGCASSRPKASSRAGPAHQPADVEYELTDFGHELLPAVDAIVAVGHRIKHRANA